MSAGFCGGAKEAEIFLEPGIDQQYNKNQKNCERREKMTYSQGVSVTAILTLAAGVGVFWYAAKKRSYVPVFLYLCVCVASLPEQLGYLNIGHDITFHLNRILGIRESLSQGMFPVRLNGFTFEGYGYADALCYPDLFLYIPAILSGLGLSFITSVNIFLLLVNVATAAVMYACAKRLFQNVGIAAVSSVLYTLCIYRLCDMYTRAAYGEMLAMIFLPLIILGFYELFFGEEKRWYLLALGFTGVWQSNLVSLVPVAALCIFFGIVYVRQIFGKKRLVALLKALSMTVLLNVWFLIPFFQTLASGVDTSSLSVDASEKVISTARLFQAFPGADDGRNLGLSLMAGLAVFLYAKVKGVRRKSSPADVFVVTGGVLALLTTDLFPWKLLMQLDGIAVVMGYLQFPWRLLGPAACFLCLGLSAYCVTLFRKKELRIMVCGTVVFCAVISAQYFLGDFLGRDPYISSEEDIKNVIVQREYLYSGTDKEKLDGELETSGNVFVEDYEKYGFIVTLSCYTTNDDNAYVEVPLFAYPCYEAVDENGELLSISRGENNRIRVELPTGETTVTVRYRSPLAWRIAELVSAISFLLVLFIIGRNRSGRFLHSAGGPSTSRSNRYTRVQCPPEKRREP